MDYDDSFDEQFRSLTKDMGAENEGVTMRAVLDAAVDNMTPTMEYVDTIRLEMLGRGWTDEGAERFAMTVYKNDMLQMMMLGDEG